MARNLVCNECGGAMKEGYIQDSSYMAVFQALWIEGDFSPWKSLWKDKKSNLTLQPTVASVAALLNFTLAPIIPLVRNNQLSNYPTTKL